MRILVIDDADRLRRSLERGLTARGHTVVGASTGERGLRLLEEGEYDVVVLDLTLPDRDGTEVLSEMRSAGDGAFVLVLSAREGVEPRVGLLQRGADDFLGKPFSFDELCARLEALERRLDRGGREIVIDDLVLDRDSRRVFYADRELPLTASEYAVLDHLVRERGRVLSRDRIWERMRYRYAEYSSNVVEVHVSMVRRKLREAGCPELIATRRGIGYTIDSPPHRSN